MNNQKEHFFDRFRSKEETDNEKIFDDYIREKDTQVRFSEINNTINSLIDLPEEKASHKAARTRIGKRIDSIPV